MSRRLELHDIFIDILGTKGKIESRVYFQPPATLKMQYPCIVYARATIDSPYADDQPYHHTVGYMGTLIDPNPDSEFLIKILSLPLCRFDRHYTSDNLNHDVFTIFY